MRPSTRSAWYPGLNLTAGSPITRNWPCWCKNLPNRRGRSYRPPLPLRGGDVLKINEVTVDTVKSWGRIETDYDDVEIRDVIMPAARERVYEYTGLTKERADEMDSLTMAYIALCVFLYDNRTLNIINDKHNAVIQGFLDAHRVNLL
nr:MAG TPA: hypothetical protein [Bacteriophage sp.]